MFEHTRVYESEKMDRLHNSRNPYYRDTARYHVNAPVRDSRKAMTWILKRVYTPSEYREGVFYDSEKKRYDIEATYVDILKINALAELFKDHLGYGWISDGYYDQHNYDHTDEEWEWAQEWAMETILGAERGSKPAPRGPYF